MAIEQARLSLRLLDETQRRERLQRYHSPGVINRILQDGDADGAFVAQERDVSVMFCDIVGFTTMCAARRRRRRSATCSTISSAGWAR